MKLAICGLRHGHMISIVGHIKEHPDMEIVAVAEGNPDACRDHIEKAGLDVTHPDVDALLDDVEFDILAVGDYYAARGGAVIKGLEAGKHILGDKPLCTRLDEMSRIRDLAEAKGLSVIVALTNRYRPSWQTARRLIADGIIGEVCDMVALGHHPLGYGTSRPSWYFEEGKHGGTLNDILIHGVDGFGWLTGLEVAECVAARAWNAGLPEVPFFQDGAQAMLRMSNGAGVVADVSYKAPMGHSSPWLVQIWGTEGDISIIQKGGVTVRRHGEPAREMEESLDIDSDCVQDLVKEIGGAGAGEVVLTTSECLASTEKTLKIQDAADTGKVNVAL